MNATIATSECPKCGGPVTLARSHARWSADACKGFNDLRRTYSTWMRNAGVSSSNVGAMMDHTTSAMIDRVSARLGRKLYEVPVGFKWFVEGLFDGSLGFGGEESAGASFSRRDGAVWTTDKDGIVPALLSAEITARSGRDPGELYRDLTRDFGEPAAGRIEAPATAEQKQKLAKLSPAQVQITQLGGEKIDRVLDRAPGNNARIGRKFPAAPTICPQSRNRRHARAFYFI